MTLARLADFPRATLAHRPTPLESMPNLSRSIGSENLFVKRDDCTGLAMGGNKARPLEFYIGDAIGRDAPGIHLSGAKQPTYASPHEAAAPHPTHGAGR